MKLANSFVVNACTITVMTVVGPLVSLGMAQQLSTGQDQLSVSGTGSAGHIAIWKSSTTLGNSQIVQSSGNVGIGAMAPAAKLEVNGTAQVDGDLTLSGSILLSGVGQLIWTPDNGSGNLAIGLGALPSATTTGSADTGVGDNALHANTTGTANMAIGTGSLALNTTGSSNTAAGNAALARNTTGVNNTASGDVALASNTEGTYNTANGFAALANNTMGSNNVAIGASTLNMNRTGNYNTAIGELALSGNTSGSSNIAIGANAGLLVTNGSDNIEIFSLGTGMDNGTIRIGTQNYQTTTFIAGIHSITTGMSDAVPVVIDSNGQLGTMSSSRRYKEDIQDMGDASADLMHLRPVTFRYKKAFDDGSMPVQYGLIAEEVAEIYPDLVTRSSDGQVATVKYQLLDPMLLNELQKQNATIATQKERIRSLEERLARVEAVLQETSSYAASR